MYYEYWGLKKPPFDNVPDPSMYVDCHSSQDSAISETLFAIREGNECIAAIYGEAGVGKTLSLRKIIDLLEPDRYRIAFVANPGISFLQLLREIIGQLEGEVCNLNKKADLLSRFRKIFFQNHNEGRKVLIFLDDANSMSPLSMESLRLLTSMQEDVSNPFTLVLAGTNELARRLEHPKREKLFQRIGVCCRLEKIKSREEAQSYIYSRLKLAGANREIFTAGAIDALWEHSGNGVPRIINKLAKLCLKTGEINSLDCISGEIVDQVASRFARAGEPALPQRRPRSRLEPLVPGIRLIVPSEDVPEQEDEIAPQEIGGKPDPEIGCEQEDEAATELLIELDGCPILVDLTPAQAAEARSSGREERLRIAGAAAAHVMKTVPALGSSLKSDPITIWSTLRDKIFGKIESDFGDDNPGDC